MSIGLCSRSVCWILRIAIVATTLLIISAAHLSAQQITPQWVERAPHGFAQAIVADSHDNSYVAGYVCTPSTCQDKFPSTVLQVIKYNKDGNTVWTAQLCNAPGNSQASSIAVDPAENVYVTGLVTFSMGGSPQENLVTVKFSSSGQQLWASYYTALGPRAGAQPRIVVDQTGNSYVADANGSDLLAPITTIKYDTNGFQLWFSTFGNGSSSYHSFLGGLALDGQGNLYVLGWADRSDGDISAAIVMLARFDPSGHMFALASIAHSEPAVLAVDAQDNAYVASVLGPATFSSQSIAEQITKFDFAGNPVWTTQYTPPNAPGGYYESGIALDNSGDVYITSVLLTGTTTPTASFSTSKFDQSGKFVWEKRYNGNGNGFDQSTGLVVDAQNFIYVAGYSTRPGGAVGDNNDIVTILYDSQGNQLCVSRYSQAGDFGDTPAGIALGNQGVFVTGTAYAIFDNLAKSQWVTIKYLRPTVVSITPPSLTFSGTVGTTSAAQQVTVTNKGNSPITLAVNASISGNNPEFATTNGTTCMSGAVISPGGSCLIFVTFTPTVACDYNATLTIGDGSGGLGTVTLTGLGIAAPAATPDFTLMAGTSSASVSAGQTATFNLQIVPTSFNGSVTLACSGAPAGTTCSVSPSSAMLMGNAAVPVVVSLVTTARSSGFPRRIHFDMRRTPWIPVTLMAFLSLLGFSRVKSQRLGTSLALLAFLTVCMGCGSVATTSTDSRSTPPVTPTINAGTPAGTSMVTVTATAGSTVRTIPLSLTVK